MIILQEPNCWHGATKGTAAEGRAETCEKPHTNQLPAKSHYLCTCVFIFLGTEGDIGFYSSMNYEFSHQVDIAGNPLLRYWKHTAVLNLPNTSNSCLFTTPHSEQLQRGQYSACVTQPEKFPLPHFPLGFLWGHLVHLLHQPLGTSTGYLQPGSVTPAQGPAPSSGTQGSTFACQSSLRWRGFPKWYCTSLLRSHLMALMISGTMFRVRRFPT